MKKTGIFKLFKPFLDRYDKAASVVSEQSIFVAIDVETANSDIASICQIGLAKYNNSNLIDEASILVNPVDDFDEKNIAIHGITEDSVIDCPIFSEIYDDLVRFISESLCVSHTNFDKRSLASACEEYSLDPLQNVWLDSAKVARRTWLEYSKKGYNLKNICNHIGYEFKHHDALEDAKACGSIIISAMQETGLTLDELTERSTQRRTPTQRITKEGDPDGQLYDHVLVFTGKLGQPRSKMAELAANAGCKVASSVTKKTTLLIVGDQDIGELNGNEKSSKHTKAEDLISQGQNIRILTENDFIELAKL